LRSAVVLNDPTHPRARRIAEALVNGALNKGWRVREIRCSDVPDGELLLAYGWKHRPLFEAQLRAGGHFLYVDLGYWHRRAFRGDFGGMHKVVLDARHATAYFQRRRPADRLANAPPLAPWTPAPANGHILVAGLSGKGAQSCGFEPYEWERKTIAALRQLSNRRIVYRPKPSWTAARPLPDVDFSAAEEPLEAALCGAHAVVTHYSNVGIDALLAGIPVVCEEGLASVLSIPLQEIGDRRMPVGSREQFRCDVSYTQFNRAEIVSGEMLRQFLEDGLIE
jgi:hypothetical protein